jgi:hypothetical protein
VVAVTPVVALRKTTEASFKVPVSVTLPYRDDELAGSPSAFYWDPVHGLYRSLTTTAVDPVARTITFETVHFTQFVAFGARALSSLGEAVSGRFGALTAIDTGFRPERDGFLYHNGDADPTLKSGGDCLGMSLTAVWYHETKGAGGPSLQEMLAHANVTREDLIGREIGRDAQEAQERAKAPRLEAALRAMKQDPRLRGLGVDSPAFSAAYDKAMNGDPVASAFSQYSLLDRIWPVGPPKAVDALWTRATNVAALANLWLQMKVTGKPQVMGMQFADGSVGHAVVVYGFRDGKLLIYDPNYPGRTVTASVDPTRGITGFGNVDKPYPPVSEIASESPSSFRSDIDFAAIFRHALATKGEDEAAPVNVDAPVLVQRAGSSPSVEIHGQVASSLQGLKVAVLVNGKAVSVTDVPDSSKGTNDHSFTVSLDPAAFPPKTARGPEDMLVAIFGRVDGHARPIGTARLPIDPPTASTGITGALGKASGP